MNTLMHWVNYKYKVDKGPAKAVLGSACYNDLYCNLRNLVDKSILVTIYMYSKFDKNPFPNNEAYVPRHLLVFSKEDIIYVFDKLSYIIDQPSVEEFSDNIGSGLCVEIEFKDKSIGYIKVITTICRYFFEFYMIKNPNNPHRGFADVMSDTIDYCKKNPGVSFIEILQAMHYDCLSNGAHSVVNISSECMLPEIISQDTFIKNMNNKDITYIYTTKYSGNIGVFDCGSLERMKITVEEYLNNINKIKRI